MKCKHCHEGIRASSESQTIYCDVCGGTGSAERQITDARLLAPGAIVMQPVGEKGLLQRFVLIAWDEGRHMWSLAREGTTDVWSVGRNRMEQDGWLLGHHLGVA